MSLSDTNSLIFSVQGDSNNMKINKIEVQSTNFFNNISALFFEIQSENDLIAVNNSYFQNFQTVANSFIKIS